MTGIAAFACSVAVVCCIAIASAQEVDLTAEEIASAKKKMTEAGEQTRLMVALCSGQNGLKYQVLDVVGIPAAAPKLLKVKVKFGVVSLAHVAEIQLKKKRSDSKFFFGAKTTTIRLDRDFAKCKGGVDWDAVSVAAFEDQVSLLANS